MAHLENPLFTKPISDFVTLEPLENPDWNFARNTRCVLMTSSAEWVQATFSCQFNSGEKLLVAPNRDYPYEGLMVYQDGENWKYIDCFALAIKHENGRYIPISAGKVKATPWQMTYCYKISRADIKKDQKGEVPFYMSYYLDSKNSLENITGCVELYFPGGLIYESVRIYPIIQPFIDIRHMYTGSQFDTYRWWQDQPGSDNKRIFISNYNRTLTFYLPPVDITLFQGPQMQDWRYKLGTGSRIPYKDDNHPDINNAPVFKSEEKKVAWFFTLQIPPDYNQKFLRLFFGCSLNGTAGKFFLPDAQKRFEESRENDYQQYQQINETFVLPRETAIRNAITARIVGLTKFKTYIELTGSKQPIKVPHAGAWWFRTPWFRDVFEGVLSSFYTLMKIPEERECIRKIILLALQEQDKNSGRILNRIPEFKHSGRSYNNSDGTLLAFITANAYSRETGDLDFAVDFLPFALYTIKCFQKYPPEGFQYICPAGPPRVEKNSGLLLSVPHHSWIDTRNFCLEYDGNRIKELPNRASEQFARTLYTQFPDRNNFRNLLDSPNFFLPEINAQWIIMLKGTIETIDFVLRQQTDQRIDLNTLETSKKDIQNILSRAQKNFKPVFWNDSKGFLYNMVYEIGNRAIKDEIECETAVTAAAMLGEEIFTRKELLAVWDWTREKLLVTRRITMFGDKEMSFGILTKNEDQKIYYNDHQYHSDVIWLRSTPYLIKLLLILNQNTTIRDILINTLDHQMTEGAIFYNQELFSRPEGLNWHPDEKTAKNPVPVKNPIQFWSQWCDPFSHFFSKKGTASPPYAEKTTGMKNGYS
jgi:hypothetical protein